MKSARSPLPPQPARRQRRHCVGFAAGVPESVAQNRRRRCRNRVSPQRLRACCRPTSSTASSRCRRRHGLAFYGKMDPGQGVDVAIGQIVADELDLPAVPWST